MKERKGFYNFSVFLLENDDRRAVASSESCFVWKRRSSFESLVLMIVRRERAGYGRQAGNTSMGWDDGSSSGNGERRETEDGFLMGCSSLCIRRKRENASSPLLSVQSLPLSSFPLLPSSTLCDIDFRAYCVNAKESVSRFSPGDESSTGGDSAFVCNTLSFANKRVRVERSLNVFHEKK